MQGFENSDDRDHTYDPQPFPAHSIEDDMLRALRAFVEQATKLQSFPHLYQPYVGAVISAKVAIARAVYSL